MLQAELMPPEEDKKLSDGEIKAIRQWIEDWHATILHLLGLDHHKLVFNRNRLDERLTHQYEPRVVREILA